MNVHLTSIGRNLVNNRYIRFCIVCLMITVSEIGELACNFGGKSCVLCIVVSWLRSCVLSSHEDALMNF